MLSPSLLVPIAVSAILGSTFAAAQLFGQSSKIDPTTSQQHVSIAYVNDIHAQLEPHPELFWQDGQDRRVHDAGGLGRIATAFEELAARRPHGMLRIDGGDTFQGSGPGAWTKGEVMVEPMNALKLDLAIPGNWAVAYGAAQLRKLAQDLNYPLIATNIHDQDTGQRTFAPYAIREIDGVRIGLIGFTDPDVPSRQPPYMSAGLNFTDTSVIQPFVDHLREKEDVELVVLITHIGLHKSIPLAGQLTGVDVLLSSDTHERTYDPIMVGDTIIVEAGAFGSFVGVLDLTLDNGTVVEREWKLHELRADLFAEQPEVKAIIDRVLKPHRERMEREIGHTDVWLERYNVISTSMDRVIADAIRQETGTDIGITNGYRFSPPTAPGPITEEDLWNWLPVELPLKKGRARGEQLIQYWEREFENVFSSDPQRLYGGWLARPSTNVQIQFDSTGPVNRRLKQFQIDGQPLDPDKIYSLAAGARAGSPEHQIHRLPNCLNTTALTSSTHDAVRTYLRSLMSIQDTGKPPLECLSRPAILRSQILDPKSVSIPPAIRR